MKFKITYMDYNGALCFMYHEGEWNTVINEFPQNSIGQQSIIKIEKIAQEQTNA